MIVTKEKIDSLATGLIDWIESAKKDAEITIDKSRKDPSERALDKLEDLGRDIMTKPKHMKEFFKFAAEFTKGIESSNDSDRPTLEALKEQSEDKLRKLEPGDE